MTVGLSFGEILGDLLSEKDMTQKQLAEALNIPPSTLSNYFQNTREPTFGTLKQIAKYFNVSTDYLLDHRTGQTASHDEDEILRVFRSLTADQREIYIAQGKLFISQNNKKGKLSDSTHTGNNAG